MLRFPFLHAASLAVLLLFAMRTRAQEHTSVPLVVVFTPEMTKADLHRIREEAHLCGVHLRYTGRSFRNGRLSTLAITVETPNGSGSARTERIDPSTPFGFRYDPRPEAEVPFSIGSLTLATTAR